MQVKKYMKINRVLIVSLLLVLILSSTMSFFGHDSFSAYARHAYSKKIYHDNQLDIFKNIFNNKIKPDQIK